MYKDLDKVTKENILEIARDRDDIILVDVSNQLYRYYYTHSNLSINNQGVVIPTGHIYGLLRLVCTLKKEYDKPAIILCVDGYDRERKSVGDGSYKSNRSKKEFNIHADTEKILEMLSVIKAGLYVSYNSKYEADDTIYSVCKGLDYLFKKNGMVKDMYICSNDRDMCQCLDDNVRIIKSFGKKGNIKHGADMIDIKSMRDEFNGVSPDNFAKYRALIGDSSDNIKGYHRIPKKLAARFVSYGEFTDTRLIYEGDLTESESRWLEGINSDYNIFKNNLLLTQLKDYPFILEKPVSDKAWDLVEFYKLNSFKREVGSLIYR